jgi:hypothetical protein
MFSEFILFVLSVYEGWLLQPATGAKPESISPEGRAFSHAAEADGDERDRTGFSGGFVR